jgi:sporulation protein YtfJ
MSENKMSDIIRSSLDGIKEFTNVDVGIGNAIHTPSGVTVIPISKISVGMATGGVDYGAKKIIGAQNFGGGGTTGVSVTPMAFLTVNQAAEVKLISLADSKESDVSKIASLIERSPEIIEKIKSALS